MKIELRKLRGLREMESSWPGFSGVWRHIQLLCGTRQAWPKTAVFTDEAHPVYANDDELCSRFMLDLQYMTIVADRFVSTGECAINDPKGRIAVNDIRSGYALLTCTWSDFHRYFRLDVQVAPGDLVKMLPACQEVKP